MPSAPTDGMARAIRTTLVGLPPLSALFQVPSKQMIRRLRQRMRPLMCRATARPLPGARAMDNLHYRYLNIATAGQTVVVRSEETTAMRLDEIPPHTH